MSSVLKGAFNDDGKIFQLKVEPPTPLLPEYIRNDYSDHAAEINSNPLRILAGGSVSHITKVYDAYVEMMRVQAIVDNVSATEVPPSPEHI